MPSLIGYFFKQVMGIYFIIDMRGFWADEKVEGLIWKKNSIIYKITKYFELKFLLSADKIISLTEIGVNEVKKIKHLRNKSLDISVISTCINLKIFKPKKNINQLISNRQAILRIGYAGSVRLWYRFDKVIIFFNILLKYYPNSILHIINKGDHQFIKNNLKKNKISPINFFIEECNQNEIVHSMQKINAGIFFFK